MRDRESRSSHLSKRGSMIWTTGAWTSCTSSRAVSTATPSDETASTTTSAARPRRCVRHCLTTNIEAFRAVMFVLLHCLTQRPRDTKWRRCVRHCSKTVVLNDGVIRCDQQELFQTFLFVAEGRISGRQSHRTVSLPEPQRNTSVVFVCCQGRCWVAA